MQLIPYQDLDLAPSIAAVSPLVCEVLEFQLQKERDKARDAKDDRLGRTWHSLMCVVGYQLRPGDLRAPLVSQGQLGALRFPAPEDLTEEELDNLAGAYVAIGDPEVRARMGDVLWLLRRDHEAARAAVAAYVSSAKRLHTPDAWFYCYARLERAFNLARSLGRSNDSYDGVVSALYELLGTSPWPDFHHLTERISTLLLGHRDADPSTEAQRLADIAEKAEADGDLHVARNYRATEAQWRRKANDSAGAAQAGLAIVELHEREGDAAPTALQACHHFERAIEACRSLASQQQRTEALIRKLRVAQEKIVGEMKYTEVRFDISETVRQARAAVASKSFPEAILCLAGIVRPNSMSELRDMVEQGRRDHPMLFLISHSVHDQRGHTVARLPGIPWAEEEDDAMVMHMHRHAAQIQDAMATAIVEPGRSQILADHPPAARDFGFIVAHSRFVPVGREHLYARGLQAGLEGDFTEATHLLIPQLENSLREVFSVAGVLPLKHLPDGTQRQKDLNDLLTDDRATEILGDDLAFTLRGLLIRASGSNLRNRLAHGLIEAAEFTADRYVYLWALTLRMVVAGALPARSSDSAEDATENENPGG